MNPPIAMTIAGVDSSGGAGVAADLNTFAAHSVWGTCAITALTAQHSLGVDAIEPTPPEMVAAQINAVCTDMAVAAVKTGMLGSSEVAHVVAATLPRAMPLVVDPVMVATTGAVLGDRDVFDVLLRRATVVTPNAMEVRALTGVVILFEEDMVRAARTILEHGGGAVLVKGGHVPGETARDCLVLQGQSSPVWLESPWIDTQDTHGTGCVLSAAITARLAHGDDIVAACQSAKQFVTSALEQRVKLGRGVGAVNPAGISRI